MVNIMIYDNDVQEHGLAQEIKLKKKKETQKATDFYS